MKITTNQAVLFGLINSIVLPQHQPAALAQRRLELAQRVATLQRIATLPVPFSAAHPWLLLPGQGYDWVFMPIENDPLYHDRRGFPMPKSLIKEIKSLRRQGVDFDELWIAHEVQPGRLQPGQRLTVEDLMPPMQPKRRPAWHGALAAVAGLMGLALLRGAYGAGHALGTMPEMPAWTPEPAHAPARPVEQPTRSTEAPRLTTQPVKAPEQPTAPAERPAQCVEAVEPPSELVRPTAQRSEPKESQYPPPEPARDRRHQRDVNPNRPYDYALILSDGRVQSVPGSNVTVTLPDGSIYIRHDVSKKPTITPDGRIIYPDEYGFTYPETLSRCYLDPILFGVNIADGVADLFALGAWAYGSR